MNDSTLTAGRVFLLFAVAALMHGAFDLATWPSPLLRPPYLRLEDAPEVFRTLSPVTVSFASSAVSGVIAMLAVAAVEPAGGRRARVLGLVLAAFWLFSGLLTHAVWLSTSWAVAAASLPLALPRGLAIGWVLSRLYPAAQPEPRG